MISHMSKFNFQIRINRFKYKLIFLQQQTNQISRFRIYQFRFFYRIFKRLNIASQFVVTIY